MKQYKGISVNQIKLSYQHDYIAITLIVWIVVLLLIFPLAYADVIESLIACLVVLVPFLSFPIIKRKIAKTSGIKLIGTITKMDQEITARRYMVNYGIVFISANRVEYKIQKIKLNENFNYLLKLEPIVWGKLRIPIYVLPDNPKCVFADFENMYFEDDEAYDLIDQKSVTQRIVTVNESRLYNSGSKIWAATVAIISLIFSPLLIVMLLSDSYSPMYVIILLAFLLFLSFLAFVTTELKMKSLHKKMRKNGIEAIGTVHKIVQSNSNLKTLSIFVDVDGLLVEIDNISADSHLVRYLKSIQESEYKSHALKVYVCGNKGYIPEKPV